MNAPQNSNQNLENSERSLPDVVIDRSKLISEIVDENSSSERYRLMLAAILEQTNQDIESLKQELTGRLRMEVQESLHLNDAEVTSFTTPIELKFSEMINALQEQDTQRFNSILGEIRELIINKNTEQHIVDIFERDSVQEKREVMNFLASNEASEKKQVFERLLTKFLPESILEQYQAIIQNQTSSLEEKYNMLDQIISQNTSLVPGISSLDDLIYMCNEVTNIGIEETGSISQFFSRLLSDRGEFLERLMNSDLTNALVPLKSYQVAADSLGIPKQQLKSIGRLTVGQVRQITENEEMMSNYMRNHPRTYQALTALQSKFFVSNGPVDKLARHLANVAQNDTSISAEFRSELLSFSANIEEEKIDTIITGYYSDSVENGASHLMYQEAAVIYRWIKTAHRANMRGWEFIHFHKPFTYISRTIDARNAQYPRYSVNQNPIKVLDQWTSRIDDYIHGNKQNSVMSPDDLLSASTDDLNRYGIDYRKNVTELQREVASMRQQYNYDISNLTQDNLLEVQKRHGISSSNNIEQTRSRLEVKRGEFEGRITDLDRKLRTHNAHLDAHFGNSSERVRSTGSGNLDTDLRRGRQVNVLKTGLFAGLTLSGGAIGLAQGTMTVKQAAVTTVESGLMMLPGIGTGLMIRQLFTGKTLSGQELSSTDWYLTLGFTALSLVTDVLALTTGVGMAAKVSLMSSVTTMKNAPALTQLGYTVGKYFTKAGRINSYVRNSDAIKTATKSASAFANNFKSSFGVFRAMKNAPSGQRLAAGRDSIGSALRSIWYPDRSVLTGLSGWKYAGAVPFVVTSRAIKTILKPIGSTLAGIGSGLGWLFGFPKRFYYNIKSAVLSKTLKNLEKVDLEEAGKIILQSAQKERELSQKLLRIQELKQNGRPLSEIRKVESQCVNLTNEINQLRHGNFYSDNVREIINIHERGSNSPFLKMLSNGERANAIVRKLEQTASVAVLGTVGVMAVGGVATSMTRRESIGGDLYDGAATAGSLVLSGVGSTASAINFAYGSIQGHEYAKQHIHRTMERRGRNMAEMAELKRQWRRFNASELASFFLDRRFRELPERLQREFLQYARSRGYNQQRLINIYNSNPE